MSYIEKRNKKIGENARATRLKRKSQICKTFKFKIAKNRLKQEDISKLKMMFVESKWIYNYLLSKSQEIDIFDIVHNYKHLTKVTHLNKNGIEVESNISHILSSVRQELMQQISTQIKALSILKKKGYKIGQLRFKSDFNSIKLKQYGVTHKLKGNKIKIQGIKKYLPLLGLKQLKQYDNIEITTANLIKEVDDYYVCLTCYIDKVDGSKQYKNDLIGIDLGIVSNLTLSNGEKISCYAEESERVKKLQARIARSKKGSNNRYKLRKKLEHAYIKDNNRKDDLANKIVSKLTKENRIIVIQDDNLNEMKDGNVGTDRAKVIQHSILGRVKSKLKNKDNIIWLDKWCPTTQYCTCCGHKTKLELKDRIFVCKNCGNTENRDTHAANNMLYFFLEWAKSKDINTSQELASVPHTIKWNDISNVLSKVVEESTTSLALC